MRLIRLLLCFLLLTGAAAHAVQSPPARPIENLQQLGEAIDEVRAVMGVPGVAVTLILPNGEEWQHTGGLADIAEDKPVSVETRFRVGSISKLLVSLAVMKLQEEGRLKLSDKLSDLAPEVAFENPWAETYPLRLVHLLNHSSGWDAPHFVEMAAPAGKPVTIGEALALHPHSRVSRWAPGTRTAYNNTGPLVAAYIVEKISGMTYEDYIQLNFLEPLQMQDSGYFYSDDYRSRAVTLYRGTQPLPYWHLNNRAAGGLHSSLRDMAKLAKLLLQRGVFAGDRVLSAHAVAETERPLQTLAAQAGLQLSWGLGNNVFHHNGVVFHGHEGSLPGASAILVYQPELGTAHVVMANGNGPAVTEIHRLIADYVTRDMEPPKVESERAFSSGDHSLSGYYRVASPVRQAATFMTDLIPWQLNISGQRATIRPLVGAPPRQLLAGDGETFKQNTTGQVALVQVDDPLDGEVLHYGPQTLKRTSALSAYGLLFVALLWVISAVLALLFMLVWLPRYFLGRIERRSGVGLRVWPLLTVIALLVAVFGAKLAAGGLIPYAMAGRISAASLMVFLGTLMFFVLALWSLWVWYRYRNSAMNRLVKYHSTLLIALNLLVGLYLLGHGVIGIRLWA
ncbi:CubicO group peptidase, beta-lactamase class C family [Microbulbifer donghaiensis]|uniref:CubicO group peptidase, beta-lactamase class C family n=1 Tax=Microbulbifer donghaiensis TaxID=494016 RepID=A0A1M5EMJ3_9GAMM|nr:serine hydrolase domain-containing protein [Microbulbifer donghaiensis]SHF80252.1 CubicO group peptidase, beta-lactamase class C family [Microbulbifer donghaiensis]